MTAHPETLSNIRATTLRAADILSCTRGAHADMPADVRAALERAIAAATAALHAVDAFSVEG